MIKDLERTGEIVKKTMALSHKDRSLYAAPIFSLGIGLCCIAIALALVIAAIATSSFVFLLFAVLLLAFAYVADVFLDAALCWMVFETVKGKKTTLGAGLQRAFTKKKSILAYAGIGLVILLLTGSLRKGGLGSSLLRSIFSNVISEGWDIAGHLLLPAIMLKDHDFAKAVKELPSIMKHLPQVLVGGFAFDLLVKWLYGIEIFVSLMFFLMLAGLSLTFAFYFSFALLMVMVLATHVFYSFTKSVYFTMLYMEKR